MAPSNQLVGIIEIDAGVNPDAPSDDNIGQTLLRLGSSASATTADDPMACSDGHGQLSPTQIIDDHPDAFVILSADLWRLHHQLQGELARVFDDLMIRSRS